MGQAASKGTGSQQPAGTEGPKPPADDQHRQAYAAAQLTLQVLQEKKQFVKEFRSGISTDLARGGTPASPGLGTMEAKRSFCPPGWRKTCCKPRLPANQEAPPSSACSYRTGGSEGSRWIPATAVFCWLFPRGLSPSIHCRPPASTQPPGPARIPPRLSPSRAPGGQTVSAGIPVCGSFEKCGPGRALTAGNGDMTAPPALLGGCTSRPPARLHPSGDDCTSSPGQAGVGRAGHGGLQNPTALATWPLQPEAELVFQVSYRHRGNAGFSWT